jgi:hypothetical protein
MTSEQEVSMNKVTLISDCDWAYFRCMSNEIDLNTFNSLLKTVLLIYDIDKKEGKCTKKGAHVNVKQSIFNQSENKE